MAMDASAPSNSEKTVARPYKCPYPLCGRAFSRLEHQVGLAWQLSLFIFYNIDFPRLDIYEPTRVKNLSSAPSPPVKKGFRGRTNSLDTLASTPTLTMLQMAAMQAEVAEPHIRGREGEHEREKKRLWKIPVSSALEEMIEERRRS